MPGGLRSGYLSDQESRTNMLQQVSVESAQSQDSRLCYLTSSEVIEIKLLRTSLLVSCCSAFDRSHMRKIDKI